MPQFSCAAIPIRKFGRADAQISALGFGGHHLGEAADGGITFFDNCWEQRKKRNMDGARA
jgi:hypothetical protein